MKKIYGITKNILVFIITCGMLLFGLEIAYRGYKFYKYNKEIKDLRNPLILPLGPRDRLEYVYKPNSEFTFENDITYKINSKGLRGRELDYKKPHGIHRILALGDSYTFGWMLPLRDSYPSILEKILNQKSSLDYEVINAGVYGYNTEQEYEFLKREGIKYNPDLVIVGFTINDLEPQNTIPRSPHLEMHGIRLWLPELIKYRINILLLEKFGIDEFFVLKRREYREHHWDGVTKEEFNWKKENCFTALRNIKNLLGKKKIPFLLVIFPSLEQQSDKVKGYDNGYVYKVINDTIKDFCEKEGIAVLDIYPFFEGKQIKDIRKDLDYDSGHYERNGNLIAAKAIAEYIYLTKEPLGN